MNEWNDVVAKWYIERYGEYATNHLAIEALDLSFVELLVDVGCGTGSALRCAASKMPDGRLIGVDPVPLMIDVAVRRASEHPQGDRIEFRQGPAESLPLDDEVADCVLAIDSLDHWKDRPLGLREIHRILKTSGLFVIGKDTMVPGVKAEVLMDDLMHEGFAVVSRKTYQQEKISLSVWTCVVDMSLMNNSTGTVA